MRLNILATIVQLVPNSARCCAVATARSRGLCKRRSTSRARKSLDESSISLAPNKKARSSFEAGLFRDGKASVPDPQGVQRLYGSPDLIAEGRVTKCSWRRCSRCAGGKVLDTLPSKGRGDPAFHAPQNARLVQAPSFPPKLAPLQ